MEPVVGFAPTNLLRIESEAAYAASGAWAKGTIHSQDTLLFNVGMCHYATRGNVIAVCRRERSIKMNYEEIGAEGKNRTFLSA